MIWTTIGIDFSYGSSKTVYSTFRDGGWYEYSEQEDKKIFNSIKSANQYSKWLKANNVTDIEYEPLINDNLQIPESTGKSLQ